MITCLQIYSGTVTNIYFAEEGHNKSTDSAPAREKAEAWMNTDSFSGSLVMMVSRIVL